MLDDTAGNGLIPVRMTWLDTRDRDSSAPRADGGQLDEVQTQSPMSADADTTPENTDESGGFVGATPDFDPESGGGVGAGDEPERGSDDDSPELDDDADVDAHPRHPERTRDGKFNGRKAGPGRPRGCRNFRTLQALELRQRIVDSWPRVDGDKLLDQLARTDPLEYLKLVARLLPPERRKAVEAGTPLVSGVAPIGARPARRGPSEQPALAPVDPAGG